MLLTLVTVDDKLLGIKEQAELWLRRYPNLVGVALNYNPQRTNVIFAEKTETIAGKSYLREIFADLEFHLRPETFFQVNTEVAEALLETVMAKLNLESRQTLLDAYCGVGTFTLPLASKVTRAIAIEVQPASIEQAKKNAQINSIDNVTWLTGKVETILPQLDTIPDLVLLDPPRQGCNLAVINALLQLQPQEIVYISCQPATLARDLKLLCQAGTYQLTFVQPADFFPQTAHLECAAFIRKLSANVL
jgi:23S rRNA (uracil1939-C5)-methyltransferase